MSVTPEKVMVSQVSQLEWTRVNKYSLQSPEGYQVTACKCDASWNFIASSPYEETKVKDEGRFFHGVQYKARYDIGDEIPPAFNIRTGKARRCLGVYRQDDFDSADDAREAAKAACLKDWLSCN